MRQTGGRWPWSSAPKPRQRSPQGVPLGQFYADETLIPGDRRGAAKSPPICSRSRLLAIAILRALQ